MILLCWAAIANARFNSTGDLWSWTAKGRRRIFGRPKRDDCERRLLLPLRAGRTSTSPVAPSGLGDCDRLCTATGRDVATGNPVAGLPAHREQKSTGAHDLSGAHRE